MNGEIFSKFEGLSGGWLIPFAGFLFLVAVLPLMLPRFWSKNLFGVISGYVLLFSVFFAASQGWPKTYPAIANVILNDYLPFIALISAFYVIAGGIYINWPFPGSPLNNTLYLSVSALFSCFIGTTGASMLMIRPIIRANAYRPSFTHVIIFFIFIVSNVAGGFTPLGDPPLFVGYLNGVDFFWSVKYLFVPCVLVIGILLFLFLMIDGYIYAREKKTRHQREPGTWSLPKIQGKHNILLLFALIAATSLIAIWDNAPSIQIASVDLKLNSMTRDLILAGIALVSYRTTNARIHRANEFVWRPIFEVAAIFFAIFITIIPAIAILRAGSSGALASVFALLDRQDGQPANDMYFWLAGGLSSFLDNAPTYLIFFNAAGGDAVALMGIKAVTLMAISTGAVFMGANTYIGNAPNLMVKTLAEQNGIRMPGFLGYMKWSCSILIPVFLVFNWIYFF